MSTWGQPLDDPLSLQGPILAFDTATPAVTIAVWAGDRVLAEETTIDARRHGELLAPGIASVLRAAGVSRTELSSVVAGTGPGPYTGLRVGLMTAQALGTALGIPAYGVCTLDALAYACQAEGPFLVATDARRKEVFWARYADRSSRMSGPDVDQPVRLPQTLPAAGAGATLYGFAHAVQPEYPSAGALAELAARHPEKAGPPEPIYLRRPDARVPGPPKRVTADRGPRGLVLRTMAEADIGAVLGIERALFPEDAWSEGTFRGELAAQPRTRYYLVAVSENEGIVGYAGLFASGDQADVQTIAVAADRQGEGIGRELLTALIEEASRRRAREVFLEVRADNQRAQKLYKAYDFVEINVRRRYYKGGVDAIVMRRGLP